MSYMAFHAEADKGIAGRYWGTKIPDQRGTLRDTGVQEFAEELLRMLSSLGPIELHRPLEFINRTNGPAMQIYNTGTNDWHGIRLKDRSGNEAQFGIGLGSEGINANSFVPHPKYSIDPHDQQRFYSDVGGNANANRNHAQAIFSGNGLIGLQSHINNFQVPFWNWFQQPQFNLDPCGNHYYLWNLVGQAQVYLTTYRPAVYGDVTFKFTLATADDAHQRGTKEDYTVQSTDNCTHSDVVPETKILDVCNLFYGCIEAGDLAVIAEPLECSSTEVTDPFVLVTTTKRNFALGTTLDAIAKGESGRVFVDSTFTITGAQSPFCDIPEGVLVAVSRDVGADCGGWVIHAADCPTGESSATSGSSSLLQGGTVEEEISGEGGEEIFVPLLPIA